ncbi:hypothetical protein BZG36_03092 [Bifiguratus adelaidae]|uniref:Phosphatidylglycerol/phosphatidylinositol transfer protein n=1 Tax=Bifiguratus adelaidae TaxID=1938954 RepID=A0A261XYW9_9FUNG|nr:hypothetical protein BZG36_03092 [Bifiguratus adelaidae]
MRLWVVLALVAYASALPVQDFFGGTIQSESITICGTEDDLLSIEHINLYPDPPVKGETLSVDFKGYLKETVEEGAYVDVLVKYGVVKILQKRFDLCEQAGQVNKSCPVEKGDFTIDKDVDLPKEIPPGRYTVNARVMTKDNEQITCINGLVNFPR